MTRPEVRKSGSPVVWRTCFRWADRFTLAAMVIAAALLFQPWWKPGFPIGFYGLLGATILQIVTAHLPREPR